MESNYSRSMQPKFKECTFDGDKDPKYFLVWVRLMSGIVKNIPHGSALENFLDMFLGREKFVQTTRPSFLEHELIDLPPPSSTASPTKEERKSKKKSGGLDAPQEVAVSTEDPQEFPSKYSDLSYESQELDQHLFHTLLTIVKGTFLLLITDLTGDYARYTFAIIALWRHANMSASNRRLQAMTSMSELSFQGEAGKWKLDFISRAREIYASGATIEHYIMQCAFSSFHGKNAQVQAMITQDINNPDVVYPGMSLEALATKYSTFMSTMMANAKGHMPINAVNRKKKKKYCTHCETFTHNTEDCRYAPDNGGEEASEDGDEEDQPERKAKPKKKCDFCERMGHEEKDCRLKAKLEKQFIQAAKDEDAAKGTPIETPMGKATATREQIEEISRLLRKGTF